MECIRNAVGKELQIELMENVAVQHHKLWAIITKKLANSLF
jgi:hypothetical protein